MSTDPNTEKLESILNDLINRIENIEKKMDSLSGQELTKHVHIEHVDLHRLENLVFRLDQLNIKELSGSLNIGNNFGVEKPQKKSETQKEAPRKEKGHGNVRSGPPGDATSKEQKENLAEVKMNSTNKGISVKFQSKE